MVKVITDVPLSLDRANYAKTQGMATKVKKWISQGIPIDGIGSQGHLSSGQGADAPAAMALLCGAASECAMTEVDIQNANGSDWANIVKACMAQAKCVGITVWGVRDPVCLSFLRLTIESASSSC